MALILLRPTIPGRYVVPSYALESLDSLENCSICWLVKVGFKTYYKNNKTWKLQKFEQALLELMCLLKTQKSIGYNKRSKTTIADNILSYNILPQSLFIGFGKPNLQNT